MSKKKDQKYSCQPVVTPRQPANILPTVRQAVVFEPHLVISEDKPVESVYDTQKDYQPKKVTKKMKRSMRAKNIVAGLLALVASALVVVPYILGVFGKQLSSLPFNVVPDGRFNAIYNLVAAFKQTAQLGWRGAEVNAIWLSMVPSLMLLFGYVFVAINALKSLCAILFAKKPTRFLSGATIYLVMTLAVLVMCLIGAPSLGIEKISFMNDFIRAFRTSDLFAIVAIAVANFILCAVCALINRDKRGYLL